MENEKSFSLNQEKTKKQPYEITDMSSLVNDERLKEYYYTGENTELLKDALDVDWVFLDKEAMFEDSGVWYGIFRKNGKLCFLTGGYDCNSDENLGEDQGKEKYKEWLNNTLKEVKVFPDAESLIEWIYQSGGTSTIENNLIESLKQEECSMAG